MQATEFVESIGPWLASPPVPATPSSPTRGARSLRSQLSLAVRQAISCGLLTEGQRLPPERELAAALHVSRPTVSAVFEDLRDAGLVRSRQGSGTWVTGANAAVGAPVGPTIPFVELVHAPGLIDLAAATAPDASLLPTIKLETSDLLSADPPNGLNPVGLTTVREEVARRCRRWVPEVGAQNIVMTSGAHQALALLVATLVPRGATVLVEDTTYGGLIDIVRTNGARVVGIERDDDGPLPDVLRSLVAAHQPAMVILVATVHSPTGTVASAQRSAELAEILGHAAIGASAPHVVVDETYADLEFEPHDRQLSRRLGPNAMRVGSLSKTAWLGLRTGWIAAPEDVCTAVTRRRWSQFDLGPSVPSQLVALAVLEELDALVATRRDQLEHRSAWLVDALESARPDWNITPPAGGLALWARLPGNDSARFVAQAADRGVAVLPGSACRADQSTDPHIRMCFDRPINVLETAMDRLVGITPTRVGTARGSRGRSKQR